VARSCALDHRRLTVPIVFLGWGASGVSMTSLLELRASRCKSPVSIFLKNLDWQIFKWKQFAWKTFPGLANRGEREFFAIVNTPRTPRWHRDVPVCLAARSMPKYP
jgi:hypothetical protein